jgi:hypothetical protein
MALKANSTAGHFQERLMVSAVRVVALGTTIALRHRIVNRLGGQIYDVRMAGRAEVEDLTRELPSVPKLMILMACLTIIFHKRMVIVGLR